MLSTFGLFETAADVCAAVSDLSKAGFEAGNLYLIARDLESDTGDQNDRRVTIAQVIDGLDLTTAAGLLDASVLVIVPEEGTYLAAGWPARDLTRLSGDLSDGQTQLCRLLIGAGCEGEEAAFLNGRLQAGALLLGIVDQDEERLTAAREILAGQQAVHVGTTAMPGTDRNPWGRLEISQPDARPAGGSIILDVSTLLVLDDSVSAEAALAGRLLVDEDGAEIGTIVAIAVDPQDLEQQPAPEYIIVRHGGFLGVGQQEYVIPIELLTSTADPDTCRALLKIETLEHAPAFDAALPISRREELAICGYYGTIPPWHESSSAGSPAEIAGDQAGDDALVFADGDR